MRVVQGFEIKPNGSRDPGPGCIETMSESLQRRPMSEARLSAAELASLLGTAGETSLPRFLVAARGMIVLPPADGAKGVIDAIVARYPGLSPRLRCLVVTVMPNAAEIPELTALDNLIEGERDPKVMGLALVTRAVDVKSPLLQAALSSGDARLVRLAQLHKERLNAGTKCYALEGTGLVKPLRALYGVEGPEPAPASPAPGSAAVPAGSGEPASAPR